MSLNRVLFIIFALVLSFAFGTESFAQVRGQRGPVRKAGIFAGWGWGNGNHWRNPGPNSGYYNPWTAHNSTYYTRGYGDPGFGPDNDNTLYEQSQTAPWNVLPGQVIDSEVEAQPATMPTDALPPAAPVETPDVEPAPAPKANGSVSGWNLDNAEFDENNLFERPVMAKPKYKPTVIDDSVNKKIQDLKDNNFWNEK